MGCTGSKSGAVANPNNPLEFVPKDIQDARPAQLRKDITEKFKIYVEKRDKLKPLLAEKYGLTAIIDEQREKLIQKLSQKEEIVQQRKKLMDKTWERDADEIFKAFSKFQTDKTVLVNILCARTYWQISEISAIFQKKYQVTLISKVVNELTTVLGTLLTGSGTGLSKLLTYRILPQHERDAALLKDCTDGLSIDNVGIVEILTTRTNLELKKAIIQFNEAYHKDLYEIIKNRSSYKNYREFVLKMLECNRDENDTRFDDETARRLAKELYDAGAGRTLGFDPDPFINILVNISNAQFESINEHYMNKQLIKDITTKLGGDFQMAVLARCTNKYDYLATRIEQAVKGWSPDKETLCRILGCLSRPDCVRVKLAYNRLGFKRTLDEALRTLLKGQVNYLNAALLLISEDTSITPLGSDKEIEEEETEMSREADRLASADMVNYPKELFLSRGEAVMKEKRKMKRRKLFSSDNRANSTTNPEGENKGEDGERHSEEAGRKSDEQDDGPPLDPIVEEEDRILNFYWDGKGRFMDVAKLTATYREVEFAENQASLYLDRLEDENNELRGIFKTILKHEFETEAYIRNYAQQVRHIEGFIRNRGEFKEPAKLLPGK